MDSWKAHLRGQKNYCNEWHFSWLSRGAADFSILPLKVVGRVIDRTYIKLDSPVDELSVLFHDMDIDKFNHNSTMLRLDGLRRAQAKWICHVV